MCTVRKSEKFTLTKTYLSSNQLFSNFSTVVHITYTRWFHEIFAKKSVTVNLHNFHCATITNYPYFENIPSNQVMVGFTEFWQTMSALLNFIFIIYTKFGKTTNSLSLVWQKFREINVILPKTLISRKKISWERISCFQHTVNVSCFDETL